MMSLDRAYINCKRCYKLSYEDAVEGRNPERDSDLYAARNDALQSLQDQLYAFQLHNKRLGQDIDNTPEENLVKKLAEACKKCKFANPAIADEIDKQKSE